MGHRRIYSVARALRASKAVRGVVASALGTGLGLAAGLGKALAQDGGEEGAVIDPGPIANNGSTMVSMVDGVPVIEEVGRSGRGRGGGGGGQNQGGGGDSGGGAQSGGGTGSGVQSGDDGVEASGGSNVAFVS